MIAPFSSAPSAGQLSIDLGARHPYRGGERRLKKGERVILWPHQVAVVCTAEELWIPRHMIARWGLRVGNIYEGLLWTGGPQVDPGWKGRLLCPIYNLAERPVELKLGQALFTIDFSYTTPITKRYIAMKRDTEKYPDVWFKSRTPTTLSAHDKYRLRSAPYEALRELRECVIFEVRPTWRAA